MRKGGERLIRALTEEFQEADAPFGCNGQLPLNNFQVIMADYDLPLLQADLSALEKAGYVHQDESDGRYVNYNAILSQVGTRARSLAGQPSLLAKVVVRIQSAWRARLARQEVARRRQLAAADMHDVGEAIEALRAVDPSQPRAAKGAKGSGPGARDGKQRDAEKRKREAAKGRDRQKEPESIDSKMAAVIRPSKENKINEKVLQARREMAEFIRATVIDHIIDAAFCYGESLGVCRTI